MEEYNKKLEKFARKILKKNGMYLMLPVGLCTITNNNGIDIYRADQLNDLGVDSAIKYNKKQNRYQIIYNGKLNEDRQRITIAKELGYFFLAKDVLLAGELLVDYRIPRLNETKLERDASYLGFALLAEKKVLKKLSPYLTTTQLAEKLKISSSVVTVRNEIIKKSKILEK